MKLLKAFWDGFAGAFTLAYVICIIPAAYCMILLKDGIVSGWRCIVNLGLHSIAHLSYWWNKRKK